MIRAPPEANIIQDGRRHPGKTAGTAGTRSPPLSILQIAQIVRRRSARRCKSRRDAGYPLVALVIPVVLLFLRSGRANPRRRRSRFRFIGTFAAMYLCGFSLQQSVADGADYRDRILPLMMPLWCWKISPAIWRRE